MTLNTALKVWTPLACRFIFRHLRKSAATGGFIFTGTTILVLLHSITTGINDTMITNSTALHYGHAFVEIPPGKDPGAMAETFSGIREVKEALPRYRLTGLIRKHKSVSPSVIFAVDDKKEKTATAISRRIIKGGYPSDGRKEVLIGSGAAGMLQVRTGEPVKITESTGVLIGNFVVSGIFRTGIDRFDESVSFIPHRTLNSDLKKLSPSELSVFTITGTKITDVSEQLQKLLPEGLKLRTWEELMPDLRQLIRLNEISAGIIMLLVFTLVGFGIANNFILTIIERFRELGILRAMGVTSGELVLLVFLESFILCVIASAAGLIAGWLLTGLLAWHGIDLSVLTSHNRYFLVSGVVYPRVTFEGIYMPFLISVAVSSFSSYLPTRIAAKKVTVETLRFE